MANNKNRVKCTGSNLPLAQTVPSTGDPYHHYGATCPVCDRHFSLPNYRLPMHYRCLHADVSRPTLEHQTYTCQNCGENLGRATDADVQRLLNERAAELTTSEVQVEPNALVSGAEGARSYAQLQPGTLVADEFGKLLGIVQGPYVSVVPIDRAHDAAVLLVTVTVDPEHPTYGSFVEHEVCISGRYLQPLEHGPAPIADGDLTSVPCEVCGRLTFAGRVCCTPRPGVVQAPPVDRSAHSGICYAAVQTSISDGPDGLIGMAVDGNGRQTIVTGLDTSAGMTHQHQQVLAAHLGPDGARHLGNCLPGYITPGGPIGHGDGSRLVWVLR